jgi:hypothetical protein
MKRWRVAHFGSPEDAERYLNGLSIEPDQIKGIYPQPPSAECGAGVILVCWLSPHQQRVEQLRRQPRAEDDRVPATGPGNRGQREDQGGRRRSEQPEADREQPRTTGHHDAEET